MLHSGREMSLIVKTSGGTAGPVRQPARKAAPAQAVSSSQTAAENEVAFQTAEGVEWRARLARLTRHGLTFEAHNLAATLRTSEVLANFKITSRQSRHLFRARRGEQRRAYRRVAHLRGQAGRSRSGHGVFSAARGIAFQSGKAYDSFFEAWQKNYRISNEFKVLVTDVQSYLTGVRHWLEQLEFGMRTPGDQARAGARHSGCRRAENHRRLQRPARAV